MASYMPALGSQWIRTDLKMHMKIMCILRILNIVVFYLSSNDLHRLHGLLNIHKNIKYRVKLFQLRIFVWSGVFLTYVLRVRFCRGTSLLGKLQMVLNVGNRYRVGADVMDHDKLKHGSMQENQ